MVKKPKPAPTKRKRVEELNSNPFIGLLNKVVNIGGLPILLAVGGWIYHGIEDTKTQVNILQNTVEQQHSSTANDIQSLRNWLSGLSQQVADILKGKH